MTTPTQRQESTLDLSMEEQWVVHHVMLDRMELEVQAPTETSAPPVGVFRIFEKLEAGTHRFTRRERRCLREELRGYVEASDTPERDRPIARDVLARL